MTGHENSTESPGSRRRAGCAALLNYVSPLLTLKLESRIQRMVAGVRSHIPDGGLSELVAPKRPQKMSQL